MFNRIVKLTFKEKDVPTFLENFKSKKSKIRAFEGCEHLELWRDKTNPQIFFTFSRWESEQNLNNYRQSDLFKDIWAKTKVMFDDKPEAWSVDQLEKVNLDSNITFGDIAENLKTFFAQNTFSKVAILVDENTKLYCLPLIQSLKLDYFLIEIDSGEENKTLQTCTKIWTTLQENHLDRNALLLNLGGGVIGDMGGFCASTYLRGIAFVQVPTTLLSMVDSSVGGKLGIDFNGAKNHIGLFRQPNAVFIDSSFLKTLPKEQLISGFGEMVKHALIDEDEMHWELIRKLGVPNLKYFTNHLIQSSLQIKSDIVDKDFKEGGVRKKLNFGHTIGHAIESHFIENGYPIFHGEAVAAGIICESWISNQKYGLSDSKLKEIVDYILLVFPKLKLKNDYIQIYEWMKKDKKNYDNKILSVLLNNKFEAIFDQELEKEEIIQCLKFYDNL